MTDSNLFDATYASTSVPSVDTAEPLITGEHLWRYALTLYHSHSATGEESLEEIRLKDLTWVDLLNKAINDFNHAEASYFYAQCLQRGEGLFQADLRQETEGDINPQLSKITHLLTIASNQGHVGAKVELVKLWNEEFYRNFAHQDAEKESKTLKSFREDLLKYVKSRGCSLMAHQQVVDWFDPMITLLQDAINNVDNSECPHIGEVMHLLGELLLRRTLANMLLASGITVNEVKHWVSYRWTLSHHTTNASDPSKSAVEWDFIDNHPEILLLWHKAAMKGHADAQYNLAAFDDHGVVSSSSYQKMCSNAALRSGCCPSQHRDLRPGIAHVVRANEHFLAAATQGHYHAQVALSHGLKSLLDHGSSCSGCTTFEREECYVNLKRNRQLHPDIWTRVCALRDGSCIAETCAELKLLKPSTTTRKKSFSKNLIAPRLWETLVSLDLKWRKHPMRSDLQCACVSRTLFQSADASLQSNSREDHQSLISALHEQETFLKLNNSTSESSEFRLYLRWTLWNLAYCYLHGVGAPRHIGKAMHFLDQAVSLGDGEAAFLLGDWHYCGVHGLSVDFEKAEKYWILSLQCGHLLSYLPLAVIAKTVHDKVDLYLDLLKKIDIERKSLLLRDAKRDRTADGLIQLTCQALSSTTYSSCLVVRVSGRVLFHLYSFAATLCKSQEHDLRLREEKDSDIKDDGQPNDGVIDADHDVEEDDDDLPKKRFKIDHQSVHLRCTCAICDAVQAITLSGFAPTNAVAVNSVRSLTLPASHIDRVDIEPIVPGLPHFVFYGRMKKLLNLPTISLTSTPSSAPACARGTPEEDTNVILTPVSVRLNDIKILQSLSRECPKQFLHVFGHYHQHATAVVSASCSSAGDANVSADRCYLVMEKPFYGNLQCLLHNIEKSSRTGPPFSVRVNWMVDILYALNELHVRGLFHGDLSPAVVWIDRDLHARLSVSVRDKAGDRDSVAFYCQAPEIANNQEQAIPTAESDMFSVALIFASILRGRVFGEREQQQLESNPLPSLQTLQKQFLDETIDHMQNEYKEIRRSFMTVNSDTMIDLLRYSTREVPMRRMKLDYAVAVLRDLQGFCSPIDTSFEQNRLQFFL